MDETGKHHNEVITFPLADVLSGVRRNDPLLDGMLVSIPREQDLAARSMTVELRGQFKRPGTYALLYEGEPMGSLITRAGGFTAESEPFGISLTRKKEKLLSGATQEQIKTVMDAMDKLLPPVQSEAGTAGKSTEVLDVPVPTMNPMSSSSRVEKVLLVSPRRLLDMPVNSRIGFKLENRDSYLARMNQVPLTDGDVIEVPRVSRVVQVLGSVQSPRSGEFRGRCDRHAIPGPRRRAVTRRRFEARGGDQAVRHRAAAGENAEHRRRRRDCRGIEVSDHPTPRATTLGHDTGRSAGHGPGDSQLEVKR